MIKAIIAPVLGGIIGYITNDLAIRMLFHPRRAVYIGRFHVPFTPGLIPSQKPRIAASIGKVISNQLLNEETLRQTILSESTTQALRERIEGWLRHNVAGEERTLGEMIAHHSLNRRLEKGLDSLETMAAEFIARRIMEADAGALIVDAVIQYIQSNASVGRLAFQLMDGELQKNTRQKLSEKVNELIEQKAPGVIRQVLDKTKIDYMNTRVCEVYHRLQGREQQLVDQLLKLYKNVLGNNLGKLLKAVDIEKIVVDKINSFDAAQLEEMIFGIMKRELRAIVYLGAALGFLMGFINLIF